MLFWELSYIRGILQACDMTSRYLCVAWLWVVVDRMRLCVLQMGLAVLWIVVGYVGAVLNVTWCSRLLFLRTSYLLRQRPFFWEGCIRSAGQNIRRFSWNPRSPYRVYGSATNPSSESFVRHCLLFRVISPSLNPVLSHHYVTGSSSDSSVLWSQFWAIIPPLTHRLSHHSADCSESSLRNLSQL